MRPRPRMFRLLPLDEPRLKKMLSDFSFAVGEECSNEPALEAFLLPVLQQPLDFRQRVGGQTPWHGYVAVESGGNRLVGICAFKGNPTASGEVEIAYGTMTTWEGHGFATAWRG